MKEHWLDAPLEVRHPLPRLHKRDAPAAAVATAAAAVPLLLAGLGGGQVHMSEERPADRQNARAVHELLREFGREPVEDRIVPRDAAAEDTVRRGKRHVEEVGA